jgi:septal ring factor EnvC (AmiA/AmiB activator)
MRETFDTIIERIAGKFQALQAELARSREELASVRVALDRAQTDRDRIVAQLDQALADRDRLQQLLVQRTGRDTVIDLTSESPQILLSDDDWQRLSHSD